MRGARGRFARVVKVLFVHNHYREYGGEDSVFAQEAALLRERGHRVVTYARSNAEVDRMGPLQRAALPARMLWARDAVAALRALVRREQPDVAHVHNTHFVLSPAALRAFDVDPALPVVQRLPNYRLLCAAATLYRDGAVCEDCVGRALAWPGVLRGCFRGSRLLSAAVAGGVALHRRLGTWDRVDRFIAPTAFAARKLAEGGVPAERLAVKPNFLHPDPGPRHGPGEGLLFAGRLTPEKGVLTLLEACARAPEVPLAVAGDGPLADRLRREASGRGLRVEWLGRLSREALVARLRGARALVFPSEWYEGFPVAIAEAFACGVPVLAARLGAMAEVVTDGRNGRLFEPGDAAGLAALLREAHAEAGTFARMGREARAIYEREYTAERSYETLLAIYAAAAERRRAAASRAGTAPASRSPTRA